MNARIKQLRDLVVALDRADRNLDPVDADAYRAAARAALALTREEMGLLPMSDFAGPVNALQNMAENIYFTVNGCFADLDGSGRAAQARHATKALLCSVGVTADAPAREVAARLIDRLASASATSADHEGQRRRDQALSRRRWPPARNAKRPSGAELRPARRYVSVED
jgi:hypothetical protein